MDNDLRPEYDLERLLKDGVRGKYVERYRAGTNLVRLAPDVAEAFPEDLPDDAQVLVVTYQNSAVDNVRARIAGDLRARGRLQVGYNVRTLHSLAYGIINTQATVLPLSLTSRLSWIKSWCLL